MVDQRERKIVIAIYSLISARLCIDPMFGLFFPSTLLRLVELAIFLAIFVLELKLFLDKSIFRYKIFPLIPFFSILAVISFGIIVRGDFSGGFKNIIFAINSYDGALSYILPFIILPLPNVKYFKSILNVFFYSSLAAAPLWLLNVGKLVQDTYLGESIGVYMPFFAAFMLGFLNRFSMRERIALVSIFFIYLLLMVLNARRNVILSLTLYFVIAFSFYFFGNIKNIRRTLAIIAGSIFAAAFLVFNFTKLADGILSNMLDRGLEDTRSQVELLFLADLASSPVADTIFGRGMDGTYFQITQNEDTLETSSDRNIIETGYLNMVLKGGIAYVLIFISILIYAVISGFKSKKKEISYISLILLTYFLDCYTTNPITIYSVRSIIFWFCVAVCLQYYQIKKKFVPDATHTNARG